MPVTLSARKAAWVRLRQLTQIIPQTHRPSLNSQTLFGSCPGSMAPSGRKGPWERAEKRLGVQAITDPATSDP